MICPICHHGKTRVINTRSVKSASVIRRRRYCHNCKKRFTTNEVPEDIPLQVVKSDNRREPFNIEKIREGILRAVEKRPVTSEQVEQLVLEVKQEIGQRYVFEVKSKKIGKLILQKLSELDPIAYIRFASVYYQYDSIDKFIEELENLKKKIKND